MRSATCSIERAIRFSHVTVCATSAEPAPGSPTPPAGEVAAGVAVTALRLGAGVGRIVLLPGRVLVRFPLVRGRTEALAAAGRDVGARGRRRLEDTAVELAAAPETSRTLDRALTEAMSDETIDALARRLLESPAFERVLRDAAGSALARDLVDDAIRSPELQRALEQAIAGPVRGALAHETKTLWQEVSTRLAEGAARADDALERAVRGALGRRPRVAEADGPRYGGLASRGVAALIDLALANGIVFALGALVGAVGVLLGVSLPDVAVAVLAGSGWTLFLAGYAVLFWSTAGQTPGMRVARLRVAGPDGRPPGVWRALLRVVTTALALAPFGAGLVPVLFDRRRRALQDLAARTIVVRDETLSA
jgi:uncharacterized RDD family membrane protein YckC